LQLGGQSVPSFGDGFDKAPLAGAIQRMPQFADRPINGSVEFDEHVSRPETMTKFFSRDHPSATVEQCEQHTNRLFAETDWQSVSAKLAGGPIDFERTKTNDGRRIPRPHKFNIFGTSPTAT
jgi:hypothetical protein